MLRPLYVIGHRTDGLATRRTPLACAITIRGSKTEEWELSPLWTSPTTRITEWMDSSYHEHSSPTPASSTASGTDRFGQRPKPRTDGGTITASTPTTSTST